MAVTTGNSPRVRLAVFVFQALIPSSFDHPLLSIQLSLRVSCHPPVSSRISSPCWPVCTATAHLPFFFFFFSFSFFLAFDSMLFAILLYGPRHSELHRRFSTRWPDALGNSRLFLMPFPLPEVPISSS